MYSKDSILDHLRIFISVEAACKYSEMPLGTFIRGIQSNYIPHRGGEFLPDSTDEESLELAKKIEIPLSELPSEAIKKYILSNINSDDFFDVDFLAFQNAYGNKALEGLLYDIQVLRDIEKYKQEHFDVSPVQHAIFENYKLSDSRYYLELKEAETIPYFRGAFKKLGKLSSGTNFVSLCPLSRDFILNRYYHVGQQKAEQIFCDLCKEADQLGTSICIDCPHNPASSSYQKAKDIFNEKYPSQTLMICDCPGEGMIHPEQHNTIQRFISSLPMSIVYFAQNDFKEWEARYGYKIKRSLPFAVNEVACADHVELDILLLYATNKDGTPIYKKPWATIMIDIASGTIIGSVLSFQPSRYTMGECFARAVCPTIKDPEIYGVPSVILLDRGRDMRSKYLCEEPNTDNYPNVGFFSAGLLPALGCHVMHCGRKSPWVKPVENVNKNIHLLCRRVPGYIGSAKAKRRYKYWMQNEFQRLKDSNRILTMEQFASQYWYNYIVPAFNNYSARGHKSHMERYRSLPRAKTLVPDWCSVSVFLHKKKTYNVNNASIRFDGLTYRHPLLDQYSGKRVTVYTLDPNYHDSIFILYSNAKEHINKYVCEAFQVKPIKFIEKNKYTLECSLNFIRQQRRTLKQGIEAIRYLAEASNISHGHYLDEDILLSVGETPAESGQYINEAATEAAKAELERKLALIEQHRSFQQLIRQLINTLNEIRKGKPQSSHKENEVINN